MPNASPLASPLPRSLVLSCLLLACSQPQKTSNRLPSANDLGAVGGTGTGASVTTPANVPASLADFPDTSVAGLEAKLRGDFTSNGGYRTWDHDDVHYMVTLNTFGVTYMDPQMSAAIQGSQFPVPVGAGAVLELYDDDRSPTPSGWAVLVRTADASDPGDWFSFEWTADAQGHFGAPQVDDLGDSSCAACHLSEPGYIVPLGS